MPIDDELDLFLMLMDEWLPVPDLQLMQLMVVEGEVEDDHEFPNVPLEWL